MPTLLILIKNFPGPLIYILQLCKAGEEITRHEWDKYGRP